MEVINTDVHGVKRITIEYSDGMHGRTYKTQNGRSVINLQEAFKQIVLVNTHRISQFV